MKRTKTYLVVIAIIAVIASLVCINAYASPEKGGCGGDTSYVLENGKLTISGSGTINTDVFYRRSGIKSIVIEEGVTKIGSEVFRECEDLTEVTIPASMEVIGSCTFEDCSNLTKVTFLGSAPEISSNAFMGVYAALYVNDTWTDDDMQDYCGHLGYIGAWRSCGDDARYIIDENGVATVSGTGVLNAAICDNPYITTLVIEDGITGIDGAFKNCTNLTEVTIPGTVQSAKDAFCDCESLVTVTLGEGISKISTSMFSLCYNLQEITIPEGVTKICSNAFQDVHALESIELPESLASIDAGAFIVCTSLKSITIPESVTTIGDRAFGTCYALKEVHFTGGNAPEISSVAFAKSPVSSIYVPIRSLAQYTEKLGTLSSKIVPEIETTALTENEKGYVIQNVDEFCFFIKSIADGTDYSGKTILLQSDIDLAGVPYTTSLWPDEKYDDTGFAGNFDGGDHVIKNLTIETTEHRGGLFRTVHGGATIKNLTMENVNVTYTGTGSRNGFGALVGFGNGTVTIANVTIKSGNISGYHYAGGIVGEFGGKNTLEFDHCVNYANVSATNNDAGGILGHASGGVAVEFSYCSNYGEIYGKSGNVGGIGGYIGDNKSDPEHLLSCCKNYGPVESDEGNVGGIVGGVCSDNHEHDTASNINEGDVTTHGAGKLAGGIVGYMEGGCDFGANTNKGNITAENGVAGGIVAKVEDDTCTFFGDENHGNITAKYQAGGTAGILGDNDLDRVHNLVFPKNYATVTSLEGDAGGIVGGLCSDNKNHHISGCKNYAAVVGNKSVGGIIGWMEGGGQLFDCENHADIESRLENAGGMIGRIEDDKCTYRAPENKGAVTGKLHSGIVCGWDGYRKAPMDEVGSTFGEGSIWLVALFSAALLAAAVIAIVIVKRQKDKAK